MQATNRSATWSAAADFRERSRSARSCRSLAASPHALTPTKRSYVLTEARPGSNLRLGLGGAEHSMVNQPRAFLDVPTSRQWQVTAKRLRSQVAVAAATDLRQSTSKAGSAHIPMGSPRLLCTEVAYASWSTLSRVRRNFPALTLTSSSSRLSTSCAACCWPSLQ